MEKKSIKQLLEDSQYIFEEQKLLKKVLCVREYIRQLFGGIDITVSVGGSYALKYWDSRFSDRIIKDYDYIIAGNEESICKVESRLQALVSLDLIHRGNSHKDSYTFNYLNMEINILIKIGDKYYKDIETSKMVIAAKKEYIADAICKGKNIRQKDIEDIVRYGK